MFEWCAKNNIRKIYYAKICSGSGNLMPVVHVKHPANGGKGVVRAANGSI